MTRLRHALVSWEGLLGVLLIAVLLFGSSLSPYFLDSANLSLAGVAVVEVGLMALPMTMLIIAGEIDISVASTLGLSSAVLGALTHSGVPLIIAIPIVLVIGSAAGAMNGYLVTRLGVSSLVVTLGTLALYRGLAYVVLGDRAISDIPTGLSTFGSGFIPGTVIPYPLLLLAVLAVAAYVVLHTTWIGRHIFAIGANPVASQYSGVPARRRVFTLFVTSGLMAALAGVIYTARFATARADSGLGLEIDVVTVVLLGGISILGGRGNLLGVILALFVIAFVRNVMSLQNIQGAVQGMVIGALLILSVLGTRLTERISARRLLQRARAAAPPPGDAPTSAGSGDPTNRPEPTTAHPTNDTAVTATSDPDSAPAALTQGVTHAQTQ